MQQVPITGFRLKHTHMLHVWNIYQHLTEQYHPIGGKYTIHRAHGILKPGKYPETWELAPLS
jgi:hypothetical protein